MRICLISPFFLPVPAVKGGAVENLITDLINQNELKRKMVIDVITIKDNCALNKQSIYKFTNFVNVSINDNFFMNFIDKKFKNNKYLFFLYKRLRRYCYNKAIIKTIRNNKYDFIITEGGEIYDYKSVYKKIEQKKSILHIHGKISGNEYLNKNYKYFICVSNFINNKLTDNSNIAKDRTRVLYNGIDINKFNKNITEKEKKKIRKTFNINIEDKLILFCGRTVKEKGVKELIEAFKLIGKDNYKLIVIGNSGFANNLETEYEKQLKESIKGYENRIFMLGHIENQELYKYYKISDIVVFPHLCEEAFGLTIVEAMISGVPIITTNVGAIPEVLADCGIIIEQENNNFIKDLAQNIVELLENEQVKRDLCMKATERGKMYSTEIYYDGYVNILKELKNENRNSNVS